MDSRLQLLSKTCSSTPDAALLGKRKPFRVAIIGGGFSGVATALSLLKQRFREPIFVHLIERSGRLGAGIAYGTDRPSDLLNVPAQKMSVFADDELHFHRWLVATGQSNKPENIEFAPRHVYGEYLRASLELGIANAGSSISLGKIAGEAHSLHWNRSSTCEFSIQLASGIQVVADSVVLATGWQGTNSIAAVDEAIVNSDRFVNNCWAQDALSNIGDNERILILGTGLSMIDVVVALSKQGYRGPITAISRRGLLPLGHAKINHQELSPELIDFLASPSGSLSEAVRLFRRECFDASSAGDWRSVIAELRPHTATIWRRWPIEKRRRFLQRLAVYWDVHRHRVSPQVLRDFQELQSSSRLSNHAGRIKEITRCGREYCVTWRARRPIDNRKAVEENRFDRIINCLGPSTDLSRTTNPLMRQIFRDGLIQADELGLGIQVDQRLQVKSTAGYSIEGLFLIGPALRANYWEATAVPELRRFAAQVASFILEQSGLGVAS